MYQRAYPAPNPQHTCKHPGTPDDSPVMLGGRNTLREALKASFHRHSRPTITLYPWGRMGAAAFVRLGGPIANLTVWARWRRQRQARHYAKHPPRWSFTDTVTLPHPKQWTGSRADDFELREIRVKELWPTDAWKRQAGPFKPRQRTSQPEAPGKGGGGAPQPDSRLSLESSSKSSSESPTPLTDCYRAARPRSDGRWAGPR